MLKITDKTIIYVGCPAHLQTGGTEALHVLAYELRNLNFNAFMLYKNVENENEPVGERFKKYSVPYVFELEDNVENVVIIPEVFPTLLNEYSNIQKAFWWLSVDNYFVNLRLNKKYKGLKKLYRMIVPKKANGIDFNDNSILHLAQSQYAVDFLEKKNIKNIMFLADYMGSEFFEKPSDLTSAGREDLVLYNPKKGVEITQALIKSAPEIKFVPIENMTPAQVRDLSLKSKVYIDFGEHPGKDRFPRETAILGNIVITNKRGAAGFEEDVPIPSMYKFDDKKPDFKKITETIKRCLSDYDNLIMDFESYRNFISKDKEKFIEDVKKIFVKTNSVEQKTLSKAL